MSAPDPLQSLRERRASVEASLAAWQNKRDMLAQSVASLESEIAAIRAGVSGDKAALAEALADGDESRIAEARRALDYGRKTQGRLSALEVEADASRAALAALDAAGCTHAEQLQALRAEEKMLFVQRLNEHAAAVSDRQRVHAQGIAEAHAEAVALSRIADRVGLSLVYAPLAVPHTLTVAGVGAKREDAHEPVAERIPGMLTSIVEKLRAEGWTIV